MSCSGDLEGGRVLRRGSKNWHSRRHFEGRNTSSSSSWPPTTKQENNRNIRKHIQSRNHKFFLSTLDAQIANRNRSDLKSQSASEIATKIASKCVEMRVDNANETAVIRIAAISKSLADWIWKSLAVWASLFFWPFLGQLLIRAVVQGGPDL